MLSETNWQERAARAILREMEHHNVNFNELSKRLAKIGVLEDASALAEKIKRGDFSAAFMLQCRDVLVAEDLVAPDVELSDATW